MDLQLQGKRAIVTGGSRGLGKAIALSLAKEGVDVVIAARNLGQLNQTALEIRAIVNTRIIPIVVDTGSDPSADALVEEAVKRLGGIDILVNNAAQPGGAKASKISEVDNQALLEVLNVKIGGYLRMSRAVTPHLLAAGWGRIISIGGLAARRTGNYTAAIRTSGVSAITKNLADELGPRGICAVAIHPGGIRNAMTDAATEKRLASASCINRMIEVDDIAWLVTVLASPRSAAINGETIQAGGGTLGVIDY